jgi:glycosyltransferase involved in cell wall biosynthesis
MALVDVLLPVGSLPLSLLQRAVASVLHQSLRDLKLIAIDDGATAQCLGWLHDAAARDPRVTICATRSPGITAALTTGISRSDAPLVARMDADDIATPWRLEHQAGLLGARSAVDLVAAPVCLEGAAHAGWIRHVCWSNRLLDPEDHARERFVDAPVVHPTVMLRRRKLDEWGGYRQGPFAEDYELWLRAMSLGGRFAKIAGTGLVWNRGGGTLTVADPRYSSSSMMRLRGTWLARELRERARGRCVIWGAGETGRAWLRALDREGIRPDSVHDVDPKKMGRLALGHRVADVSDLGRLRPWQSGVPVLVAVAAPGARYRIGAQLRGWGAHPGRDWLPVA